MAMPDMPRHEDDEREAHDPDGEAHDDAFEDTDDAHGELELGDDDTQLPWLEGDDEDEDRGGGSAQLLLLAVLAIGALALILGGIWWFTRDRADSDLVADGSVIEAPAQPYKERPEDPGGKTFEGTGDTSFAVSEGQSRQARLDDGGDTPEPGFESVEAGGEADSGSDSSGSAADAPTSNAPSGPAVQVGAFSTRAAAESAWSRLSSLHSALNGQRYRVVEGRADIGTVYRLQALPGDRAAANTLCNALKSAGQDCSIKN